MTAPIMIEPIGIVHNDFLKPDHVRVEVSQATIEIFPQYRDALLRLGEHSHIWVMGWFHQARRDILRVIPRINEELGEYGVFGLRAFSRPNPIGLTPVKLVAIEDNILTVDGLDFIDGTPVVDIKPYYEQDIIFSPDTPYIKPRESRMVEQMLFKAALNHHQEECEQLILAVKMCVAAEEIFGQLTAPELKVHVEGSSCLADAIQGICKARLANPERFSFVENSMKAECRWENRQRRAAIGLNPAAGLCGIKVQPYQSLFDIKVWDKAK